MKRRLVFLTAAFLARGAAAEHPAAPMKGVLGPYPVAREASGTAWLPDSTPPEGIPFWVDGWTALARGFITGVYDVQGGGRGEYRFFSGSLGTLMARRPVGAGTWSIRTGMSLEPFMGKRGYPALFQTGGTSERDRPLIDRQYSNLLLTELSTAYNMELAPGSSVFIYAGLPGEPALGPAAFTRRFSAQDNPEPPIAHRWLDITQASRGVMTLGFVRTNIKVDASAFSGHEPDHERWGVKSAGWDSHALRLTVNPTANLSLQGGSGRLHGPDPLEPGVDVRRTTLSATWGRGWGPRPWQATAAWGRNREIPGQATNALLLEAAAGLGRGRTAFGRVERVEKDGLFRPPDPRAGRVYTVGKLSGGMAKDVYTKNGVRWGAGASVGVLAVPPSLKDVYGKIPLSFMLFVRGRLDASP